MTRDKLTVRRWCRRTICNPRWLLCLPILIVLWAIAIVPMVLWMLLAVIDAWAPKLMRMIESVCQPTIGPVFEAINRFTRGGK